MFEKNSTARDDVASVRSRRPSIRYDQEALNDERINKLKQSLSAYKGSVTRKINHANLLSTDPNNTDAIAVTSARQNLMTSRIPGETYITFCPLQLPTSTPAMSVHSRPSAPPRSTNAESSICQRRPYCTDAPVIVNMLTTMQHQVLMVNPLIHSVNGPQHQVSMSMLNPDSDPFNATTSGLVLDGLPRSQMVRSRSTFAANPARTFPVPTPAQPLTREVYSSHYDMPDTFVQNTVQPAGQREDYYAPTMYMPSSATPIHAESSQQQPQSVSAMSHPSIQMTTFTGSVLEYVPFIKSFELLVESKEPDDEIRLYYLEHYTSGKPNEIVRSCQILGQELGYRTARQLLHDKYGDRYAIAMETINDLLDTSNVKSEDYDALEQFSIRLLTCSTSLESMGFLTMLNKADVLRRIVAKLPSNLEESWRHRADIITYEMKEHITVKHFSQFVERKWREYCHPMFGKLPSKQPSSITTLALDAMSTPITEVAIPTPISKDAMPTSITKDAKPTPIPKETTLSRKVIKATTFKISIDPRFIICDCVERFKEYCTLGLIKGPETVTEECRKHLHFLWWPCDAPSTTHNC